MSRRVRSAVFASALALGLCATLPVRAARADRASAEAAMPGDRAVPFLLVTKTTTTSGAWDDLPRLPEYAVYPDGLFLLQKSDQLLWAGRLSHDQTVDLMRFLLDEASVQSIDMRYLVSMPITTFTQYTLRTKLGTWSPRRRASGGYGPGVKEGERALAAVDQRIFGMADLASRPYQPGSIFAVARPVGVDARIPEWTANDRVPFAALVGATSVETGRGAVLSGSDARLMMDTLGRSGAWRFGTLAAEFRIRPALPEEGSVPRWRSPSAVDTPPAPAPPAPLPVPPPMVPPTAPRSPATPSVAPPPAPPVASSPPPSTPLPPPSGPLPVPSAPLPPAPAPIPAPVAPPVAQPEAPSAPPVFAPAEPPPAPPAQAASLEWRDDDLDYAGLQQLLADMKRKSTGSPHASFWKLSYAEFVALEFDLLAGTGKVRMMDKGSGTVTNLVRAFRGEPLTIRLPDGSTREEKFSVMPPKGAPMPEADIVRIQRWVDHGAPEHRPTAGAPTVAPPGPALPPAVESPGAAPAGGAGSSGGAWTADDLDYAGVQQLFADMKRKATGSPHSTFWKLSYEEFVALEFDLLSGTGKVKMLEPGNGAASNLVKALKGEPLTVLVAGGGTRQEKFAVMPPKGAPMPDADIERIRRWIDHGAPKERPAGGGVETPPGPVAPTAPTAPAAAPTPTGDTSPLSLVGEGTLKLGPTPAVTDDGNAPPKLYVARDATAWTRIFDEALARLSGANGPTCAVLLKDLRSAVKGYDFATGPLVLVLGPATDNHTMKVGRALELLSDGSARLPVTTGHEQRTYVRAPDILVNWTLHRIAGPAPEKIVLWANGVPAGEPVGGG